jgi:hypothetical protein
MRKTFVWAAAIGGLAALLAFDAGAMPLTPGQLNFGTSDLTLVRDGCGPGFRFSNSRQRCVPDDVRGGPPRMSARVPFQRRSWAMRADRAGRARLPARLPLQRIPPTLHAVLDAGDPPLGAALQNPNDPLPPIVARDDRRYHLVIPCSHAP